MNGASGILRSFVIMTIVISVLLLTLNFVILSVWVFKGMGEGKAPNSVSKGVAEGLAYVDGRYVLNEEAGRMLKRNGAWAMLVDHEGVVAWRNEAPEELPDRYSLTDIAKLSRYYLHDYPVFVWEHSQGLVVVGYPKNSLAKYPFVFPVHWVSNLPFRIIGFIVGNIGLAMLLSLFFGVRLINLIRPLVDGISSLAKEHSVYVEPKGVFSGLAKSINRTSLLLEEKNAALVARDEARANWISGISHDIRTPLSMVLGYASELEENEHILVEQRHQAKIIRQQGEKLRYLVSDLNLVSKLEYEMQPLNMKVIKLSALARQTASEFLNNGLDERYSLQLNTDYENIKVYGDEKLLLRAMMNLVQNSVTHNPEGCRILLQTTASPDEKECRFIVSDNGKGVAHGELDDLTELPYSIRRRNPVFNGHGLGIPMVSRIAKAHHGQLILESDSGRGFRAEIVLPVCTD